MKTVVIAGRPNVGKSTFFNRLTGTRHALVDDQPGVTRDRRYGDANLLGLQFRVVDTAGLEEADEGTPAAMQAQTQKAFVEADLILMVIDARAGVTPEDRHWASLIRRTGKPVLLLANKAEGNAQNLPGAHEAHSLGLGEPVPISAEHGEGLGELYQALAPHFEESADEAEEEKPELQIAILGRPNAGKSTLVNALLKEERVLVGPEAGLTRDSISVPFTFQGHNIRLVDTAGLRKKSQVQNKLEQMSVADSLRSVQFAQVVILVLDAEAALEKQDNTLAALVEKEGRSLVIAISKWDKVKESDKQKFLKILYHRMGEVMPQVTGVPVIPICAPENKGLDKLMTACFEAYARWNKRVSTGELNRWLEAALAAHTPPLVNGRRIKLRYMTQHKTRPPTFALFGNQTEELPESYRRYLLNGLRERFDLPGVPIRLWLRTSKNPYAE